MENYHKAFEDSSKLWQDVITMGTTDKNWSPCAIALDKMISIMVHVTPKRNNGGVHIEEADDRR